MSRALSEMNPLVRVRLMGIGLYAGLLPKLIQSMLTAAFLFVTQRRIFKAVKLVCHTSKVQATRLMRRLRLRLSDESWLYDDVQGEWSAGTSIRKGEIVASIVHDVNSEQIFWIHAYSASCTRWSTVILSHLYSLCMCICFEIQYLMQVIRFVKRSSTLPFLSPSRLVA